MDSHIEKDIKKLLCLVSEKYELVKEIRAMTQKQRSSIHDDKLELLLNIINQKQECIDKVNELDKQFLEVAGRLKKTMKIDSMDEIDYGKYPELAKVRRRILDIVSVLNQIKEIENGLKKDSKDKKNQLKMSIDSIKRNKKGILGYNKTYSEQASYFIDKKK
ncbi:MAG: flagellar protein FlgN [Clostridia bacterium]|nr:flagellar protein FlgN [Clostridia bacterium]